MRTKLFISALCAFAALAGTADVPGKVTLKTGDVYSGAVRWSARDKAYVVTKGKLETQYKVDDVESVEVEKPAAFAVAAAQVAKGQGAAAIPALRKIVKDYAHLQWDKIAGRYLAEAYVADEKPAEALKVCQGIIDGEPSAAYRGDLAPAYWSALLSLNRQSQLEKALERAEKGDDRFSHGAALIMRGDIAMKAGNGSGDACKKALIDGYLRVVFLYKDAEIADRLRPEALYKAARCFDTLNHSTRADTMRTELKRAYANSPWANK
ncbi:MAG: hypothetical protein IJQ00_01490 [Kiritimatiellae bacterium]|nr:hypothetical protein [Kiritimatiellia bacterium]